MASRYGSEALEFALYELVRDNFNHNLVTGLTEDPLILVERPIPGDIEPYVYINTTDSEEINITKSMSARTYFIVAQVVTRSQHNQSAERQRDQIVDQVVSLIDTDPANYIDAGNAGYNVYVQSVKDVVSYQTEERGATYWITNINIEITASFLGAAAGAIPEQLPIFSFQNWAVTPQNFMVANYDNGDITTQLTGYSTPNNGFAFDSATVAITSGSDGTLTNNVLTVDSDDNNISLSTALTYTSLPDGSMTEVLSRVTPWTRVNPLRFGSIAGPTQPTFSDDTSASVGLRNLTDFTGTNRDIRITAVDPNDQTLRITANAGDYIYFMYDSAQSDLASVMQDAQGIRLTITDIFDSPVTVGDYKIYLSTNPIPIGGVYTIILNT